jgi:beta-xylosidase
VTRVSRRHALAGLAIGAAGAGAAAPDAPAARGGDCAAPPAPRWAHGVEQQRRADLGDGRFLNPILAGDFPDPSILRVGDEYFMTFSSFEAVPGLVVWQSRDLVSWTPRTAALRSPVGSVWAPELCRHGGRFFVYFHARTPQRRVIYAIHAPSIDGPWSAPVELGLPRHIDPGHAVGEDGRRYLFLSGGDRVRLADDGLALDGEVEHVYDPWRYPEDWDVESFSPEGPKVLRRDGWYYLITAVGGTAGPPTGHMVIAARSRSIHGPWVDAPNNPLVRTSDASEYWWSRGHATLVEGPDARWYMVYHGYERGFWTLGRQALLDPVEWRADGWFEARGGDLSRPLPKPRARAGATLDASPAHGIALSDDFSTDRLGLPWAFYAPEPGEANRLRRRDGVLAITGKGETPVDCSPLCFVAGDLSYSFEVDVEIDPQARGGVLLFYSRRLYCGLGFDADGLIMHRYGTERRAPLPPGVSRRLTLRIANDRHIVTIHHRLGEGPWRRYGVQMEVSGYHHNVAGEFLSLRPAIYAAGRGAVRFRALRYAASNEVRGGRPGGSGKA